MAKDGKMSLPSVDDYKGPTVAKPIELPPPPSKDKGYIHDDPGNHQSQLKQWKTAEAQLDREDAAGLRSMWRKLEESGATTKDGQHVSNKAQTIRWLIQNPPDSLR